ncbi:hypothetical protein D9758_007299 [Tetrapyrgos nigripes]|uniref:Vps72/YL1 C-terminal domain-containing protein n=1 Tax=Tetrapyrgos nigripes TaxID=182062 RepID=A0A8H5GB69_9AGAR|nr:hypothetical protein D9758_007299 [Tetrapyrgos nigripes]
MAEEVVESLVSRRSRRSTAGNRMAVALAEMAQEEQSQDLEDDKDFTVEKFEEDAFESDFASTDDEAPHEEGGEKEVAKTRLERATAAAHERQKVTFDPAAHVPSAPKPKKPKRRVSLGVAINAETGEVIPDDSGNGATRKSKRGSTRLNTTETVKRALQEEEKKAQAPKKAKIETRVLTQGELIARALDNEEGNIVEHRDYLILEEERRKKARVVRETVTGPLIRWVSKIEKTKVKEVVQPPAPQPQAQLPSYLYNYANQLAGLYAQNSTTTPYGQYSYYYNFQSGMPSNASTAGASTSAQAQTASTSTPTLPSVSPTDSSSQTLGASAASSSSPAAASATTSSLPMSAIQPTQTSGASTSTLPMPPPVTQLPTSPSVPSASTSNTTPTVTPSTQPPSQPTTYNTTSTTATTTYNPYISYSITSHLLASLQQQQPQQQPPQPQPQEVERIENVTKNYVVHELGQFDEVPKPQWKETMEAMFGDHVNWEELKVYSGRMRPLGRPMRTCPVSGLPAKYLDPRTGVPYADVKTYKTLTALLEHQYVWSADLGCYVGAAGADVGVDAGRGESNDKDKDKAEGNGNGSGKEGKGKGVKGKGKTTRSLRVRETNSGLEAMDTS